VKLLVSLLLESKFSKFRNDFKIPCSQHFIYIRLIKSNISLWQDPEILVFIKIKKLTFELQ